jgi:ATP phosphoribosyltransferase
MRDKQVRLALPSKGVMEGETQEFLEACGFKVKKTNPRQYSAAIPALPDVVVVFQRPRDIPMSVANGDIDLGITGYDTVVEMLPPETEDILLIHEALGYGDCRLVFAVPILWDDVHTLDDLIRKTHQKELRVATKYTASTERFLKQLGIHGVRIIHADGALEAAPSIGYADLIADLTSSGTTLRENNLRPLDDGVIVDSQAVFIGNRRNLLQNSLVRAVTEQMLEFFEAHLAAKNKLMIFANMRGETLEEISAKIMNQPDLGGLQHPTIAPLITDKNDGNWWSMSIVVHQKRLYAAIQQIRAIKGSGVVVTPVKYIFNELPTRSQRLIELFQHYEVKI